MAKLSTFHDSQPSRLFSNSIADCEIYPEEEVRIVDTGEFDEADLGSLFGGGGGSSRRERERGFAGTALAGGPPEAAAAAAVSAAAQGSVPGSE